MFPLYDTAPRSRFPLINYLLIAANITVFLVELSAPNIESFIYQFGFIPNAFSIFNPQSFKLVLSSMFLHGSLLHIISNMWFLHIFGDNIEDRLGHILYLLFYICAGTIAMLTQYFFMTNSGVPMIGASGAVSAVAGAYYVLYRHSRVHTVVTLFFFWTVIDLPASFVLGYWFMTQLFAGIGSLAAVDVNQGGIAFFAHIGGFMVGYLVASFLKADSVGERS